MSGLPRFVPAAVTICCLAWLGGKAISPGDTDGSFDVQEFSRLPVVYQGRVKPYDTLARNALIIISDRQSWRDADGRRRPAIEWLLDVISNSPRELGSRLRAMSKTSLSYI